MNREISLKGEFAPVTLSRRGKSATLGIAGRQYECMLHQVGSGEYNLAIGGKTHRVWVVTHRDAVWVHAFGRAFEMEVLDPVERAARTTVGSANTITAPMPGTVVAISVVAGETVKKGQALMLIESMKMQTEILAGRDSTVEAVTVSIGATFDRGARLISLKQEE